MSEEGKERQLKETPRQKVIKFERAPFSDQFFTKDKREKFNNLPSHVRQLVSRVVDHGNLPLAASEAGIGDRYKSIDFGAKSNLSIIEALKEGGITPMYLVQQLRMCLDAETGKEDRDGNPIIDLKTKIKTLELLLKLRGDFGKEVVDDSDSVLDMFEKKKDE